MSTTYYVMWEDETEQTIIAWFGWIPVEDPSIYHGVYGQVESNDARYAAYYNSFGPGNALPPPD